MTPQEKPIMDRTKDVPEVGDTVIIARGGWGWNLHGESFAIGTVERVTPKKIFTEGKAHHRSIHDKHLCVVVASRDEADKIFEKLTSAKAELTDRVSKARLSYQAKVEKLLNKEQQP